MKRLITAALLSSFLFAPTLAMAGEKEAKAPRMTAREVKDSLRPSEIKATAKQAWNSDKTNMVLVSGWMGGRKALAYPGGPKEKLIQGASTAVKTAVVWTLANKFLAATAPKTPEQKAQIQAQTRAQADAMGQSYARTRVVNAIRGPQLSRQPR